MNDYALNLGCFDCRDASRSSDCFSDAPADEDKYKALLEKLSDLTEGIIMQCHHKATALLEKETHRNF